MKVIEPSFEIIEGLTYQQMLQIVEGAYRICYASEPKGDAEEFIRSKMKLQHLTPIEHILITVDFTMNRGVTHELVRHRVATFSQQSTRYCNYGKDKFGKEITVTNPPFFNPLENTKDIALPYPAFYKENTSWHLIDSGFADVYTLNKFDVWYIACLYSEWAYMTLLKMGATPQEARSVLPNSLAAKIRISANLREWRLILNQRAIGITGKPHPEMLASMLPVLERFKKDYPVFFEDLIVKE